MVVGDGGGDEREESDKDHSDGVIEMIMAWLIQKGAVEVLVLVSVFLEYFCAECFHVPLSPLVLMPALSE